MKTNIFVIGTHTIPKQLKAEDNFSCTLIENPYDLRTKLTEGSGENIIVVYLPFLEIRHFELYSYFQKALNNVKTIFVVNELSESMRIKIRSHRGFIVLWKTEEAQLAQNIHTYLEGKNIELRQDKREPYGIKALLSPSLLPAGVENKGFQAILGGSFANLSSHGSCLKIQAPFYTKKDFVNLTYQNKEGEFVSLEGQVRWTKWNEKEKTQELGVRFVTR